MRQRCEVCENFRPDVEFAGDRKTVMVPFDVRPVRLCAGHARIAQNSGVTSFEGLRELYGAGRRSFVPRRSESTPTAFGEKRDSPGRRASDHRLRLDME
jgi:hypothetical protein